MATNDRLQEIADAHAVVMPGHFYTREHFPYIESTKFVGHTPAVEHERALDVVLAGVPWLLVEYANAQAEVGVLREALTALLARSPWKHNRAMLFDDRRWECEWCEVEIQPTWAAAADAKHNESCAWAAAAAVVERPQ